MLLLSRYILKNVAWTTLLISLALTMVIWLTQSLRLLDFIINGGAPMSLFGSMLLLTMPKFLEIILPVSLALAIVYSLNKFSSDSELVVMQNTGVSPARLGNGVLLFSIFVSLIVLFLSGWATPMANRELDRLRDIVKSDYSFGLLRPGVFNVIDNNTTIYIAERSDLQDLNGVFIQFTKDGELPTTITAQHGGLITQDKKPYVIVFDGMRQQFNPKTGTVETLKFERYSLNLSSLTNTVASTRDDPSEKTIADLVAANKTDTAGSLLAINRMNAELHSRLSRPLLTLAFALLTLVPFMTSHYNRKGQSIRVTMIIIGIVMLQSMHLASSYLAAKSVLGLLMIYGIPTIVIFGMLSVLLDNGSRNGVFTPIQWLLGGKERLV